MPLRHGRSAPRVPDAAPLCYLGENPASRRGTIPRPQSNNLSRRIRAVFCRVLLAATVCLAAAPGPASAQAVDVALVIGAGTGAGAARAVSGALAQAGYDVTLALDASPSDLRRDFEAFAEKAKTARRTVVYYDGPLTDQFIGAVMFPSSIDPKVETIEPVIARDLARAAAPASEFSLVVLDTTGQEATEAQQSAGHFLVSSLAQAENQTVLWSGPLQQVASGGGSGPSRFATALADRIATEASLDDLVSGVLADTTRGTGETPLVQNGPRAQLVLTQAAEAPRGHVTPPVFLEDERGREGGWATRIFAGPGQFPPTDFRTYGIVAFPARAAGEDEVARHQAICRAWAAVLPSAERSRHELPPRDRQMATIWPIDDDAVARRLNLLVAPCEAAVERYGLVRSLQALRDARRAGFEVSGEGPFLLAWSPPSAIGAEDAVILAVDLSRVRTQSEAVDVFRAWRDDIESDPGLWGDDGWSLERFRVALRQWADLYGPRLLSIVNG